MKKIVIYSKTICPYCVQAKILLKMKKADFEEIKVDENPEQFDEMLKKSNGRRTVPQIFIGDEHVGGFDDLKALEDAGKLEAMLA